MRFTSLPGAIGGRSRKTLLAATGTVAVLAAGTIGYSAYADAGDFQAGISYVDGGVPWGDSAAMDSATEVLSGISPLQNQHIIGFGADELWPDPNSDERDWSSLDERIEWIKQTGGTPVITLCSAPGWMKPSGDTWEMDEAPLPEYFDEYAQLSAEVADRYSDDVQYFQVWNEFKGFWDGSDLKYAEYTDFYNQVYNAVRDVNPDAKLGGPYVSLRTAINGSAEQPSDLKGDWGEVDGRDLEAIEYWMDNKAGADFFTVDGWSIDEDGNALDVDGIQSMYTDITEWMVAHADGLPVWWSEFYAPLSGTPKEPGESSPEAMTAALTGMSDGGTHAMTERVAEATKLAANTLSLARGQAR
ncbi:MAG: hypothetical protein ACRD0P_36175, partial [Stackebrandtia sp.]